MTRLQDVTRVDRRSRSTLTALSLAAAITVSLVAPGAEAQGSYPYQTTQSYHQGYQYPSYQGQRYASRGPRFRFAEQPVVGRSLAGVGWNFGGVDGIGMIAEGALSFRLESQSTYRRGRLQLVPEIGFVYTDYYRRERRTRVLTEEELEDRRELGLSATPGQTEEVSDFVDPQPLFLGMAGIRFGWGQARIGDLYVLGRVLAGAHWSGSAAFGLQTGVGGELWYGLLALEVSHTWTYDSSLGNVHGLRIALNVDVIRGLSVLTAIILSRGSFYDRLEGTDESPPPRPSAERPKGAAAREPSNGVRCSLRVLSGEQKREKQLKP